MVGGHDQQLLVNNEDNVIAYRKGKALFFFNFDPSRSYDGYFVPVPEAGEYQVLLSSDDYCYGGDGRIYHQLYTATKTAGGKYGFRIYLPSRTAIVFRKV